MFNRVIQTHFQIKNVIVWGMHIRKDENIFMSWNKWTVTGDVHFNADRSIFGPDN